MKISNEILGSLNRDISLKFTARILDKMCTWQVASCR